MDTQTTTAAVITAQDVRALRNADDLVFRTFDGSSALEAIQDADNSSTGYQQRRIIQTDWRITDYGNQTRADNAPYVDPHDRYNGFHMSGTVRYNDVMRSIIARIRTGDTLTLHWRRDNNTQVIREAGLHSDDLLITITHPAGKTGTRPPAETYKVTNSIGPDNSARMIKRRTNT